MHCLIFLFILVLFNASILPTVDAFSIDLIHRDSILPRLHSNSNTLPKNVVMHSINGANHFNSSVHIDAKYAESDMSHLSGDYLMEIRINSTYEVLAVASMTSDLTWIQCEPCKHCYPQDKPIFQPGTSETCKKVKYGSLNCEALLGTTEGDHGECEYEYIYGKGRNTSGELRTENFYLRSLGNKLVTFEEKVFGCGHRNHMPGLSEKILGVVGLGRGNLSLTSQLGSETGGTFSYCLTRNRGNTKLKFGPQPSIPKKTATLELFPQPTLGTSSSYYVINLKAITIVNHEKFEVEEPLGFMTIDIGTTDTALNPTVYDKLRANVQKAIKKASKKDPVQGPIRKYELCYNRKDLSLGLHEIPDMKFCFTKKGSLYGSKITLKSSATFLTIGDKICMAIIRRPSPGPFVLGSMAQVNFQVEYEPKKEKVTFTETDCGGY